MPIPTTIESLSVTAASNGPAGSEDRSTADDGLRQAYAFIRQSVSLGSSIASASSITPPSTGSVFNITGVTAITAIASTNAWDGRAVTFIFAGILTLTHSANLALPGSVNITTAANDVATFVQTGSGAWRMANYTVASVAGYLPLSGGTLTGALVGTAATFTGNTALGDAEADTLSVSGAVIKNATGNWLIPAPSSGVTVSATAVGANATFAALASDTTGKVAFSGSNMNLSFANWFATGAELAAFGVLGVGTTTATALNLFTNSIARVTVAGAGNVTIAAPSAGTTLALSAIGGQSAIALTEGVTTQRWFSSAGVAYFGTSSNHPLVIRTNDTDKVTVAAAGNVTLAAPSAGVGLTQTGFAGSDTTVLNGGTSGSFRVTDRGLPYGTAIHNNAGAVTGTTNQYITSGSYTPTLTHVTNVSASTARVSQWLRVGNVVTVSGSFNMSTTANVATELGVSLPIASALTLAEQVGGSTTAFMITSGITGVIHGDATNDRASLRWSSALGGASSDFGFHFTYLIL